MVRAVVESFFVLRPPNDKLLAEPTLDRRDHVGLVGVGQCFAAWNLVPFRQTSTTAGRGCVLRDEHRVSAKWCLLPIVARRRRRQSPSDQLFRLDENSLETTRLDVLSFGRAEVKPATKGRIDEGSKKLVERSHQTTSPVSLRAPSAFDR